MIVAEGWVSFSWWQLQLHPFTKLWPFLGVRSQIIEQAEKHPRGLLASQPSLIGELQI